VTSIDTPAAVVGRKSASLRAAPATVPVGVAALGASWQCPTSYPKRNLPMPHEYPVPQPYNDETAPGRTIYPEPMRMAEQGWARPNYGPSEYVTRREAHVEDEERSAARDWLRHVEAGRIG